MIHFDLDDIPFARDDSRCWRVAKVVAWLLLLATVSVAIKLIRR
jgi:hypothetical protein